MPHVAYISRMKESLHQVPLVHRVVVADSSGCPQGYRRVQMPQRLESPINAAASSFLNNRLCMLSVLESVPEQKKTNHQIKKDTSTVWLFEADVIGLTLLYPQVALQSIQIRQNIASKFNIILLVECVLYILTLHKNCVWHQ
jgi:hypothetical protein